MDTDITIIGAGVVGLAIAAELADKRRSVTIVEKEDTHGRGTSSRNSEVVHAGIYYPPGSLKARLCVEGRPLLYETCVKHGIPHAKPGKLIIALTDAERTAIAQLAGTAEKNGAPVQYLEKRQVRELEPNIKAADALHSPETGIINAHALMDHYLRSARMKGADIAYRTTVEEITPVAGGWRITTTGADGERFAFESERVVNAAGLQSDRIANMVGGSYTLHYCKGDYFGIQNVKRGTVRRLVYPVPEKDHVGLGVHLTLDLSGRMRLGPDTTYIGREEDYRVDGAKREQFYASAVKFLPFLKKEDIVPEMSGIRPKLQGPGDGFRDFVIKEERPGFINLVGIESPGLTAAPAIARYVGSMMQ